MYSSHQSALYQEGRYPVHTQWQQVLQSRPDTQCWWQRGRDSGRIQGDQHKLAANDTKLGHELANQKCSGWSRHLVPSDNQWWQDCHLHKRCSTTLELWSNLWRGSVPVSHKKAMSIAAFSFWLQPLWHDNPWKQQSFVVDLRNFQAAPAMIAQLGLFTAQLQESSLPLQFHS